MPAPHPSRDTRPDAKQDPTSGEVIVTDDLELLLVALPPRIRLAVQQRGVENLLEIVLDLGRPAEARYSDDAGDLGEEPVTADDIATELEAQAARTIGERGVQLIGTAHGRTLENLLLNPTLSDLVGGIAAVTLGDEEARRRGTQKTVLERKAPPTFDVLVEQEERHIVGVHHDVAEAVDSILRGEAPRREMRERQADGTVRRWIEHAPRAARADGVGLPMREAPVQREELANRRGGGGGAQSGTLADRPARPPPRRASAGRWRAAGRGS